MPVSTRTRFEVFKRDLFTCQYCGRKPPEVILHADHVIAASAGGKDTRDNLVTSCAAWNLGKSNVPLTDLPDSLSTRAAQIAEARAQLKAYSRLQTAIERDTQKAMIEVAEAFRQAFHDRSLTANFLETSVRRFLDHLTPTVVALAMRQACAKQPKNPDVAAKYFCGICWRLIKEDGRHQW